MLRQVKKLLAFILALALVFTTFTSDYTSAKVFAEGDTTEEQSEPEEEQEDSEDESEDEEDSEDEDSEDEESDDEESEEEASDDEESEEPKEEIPEEEIPEEEIPEEEVPEEEVPAEEEEPEEDEEGHIVITYVVDGEGGSVSNTKESFDPESEEEITIEGSTAKAEEGFEFAGWTGGYLEEALMDETFVPDYTLITENATFTASFEAIEEPEEEKLGPVKDSTVVNGIKISLHAEEGILPADAKLVVKTLEDSDGVSISEEDVKEAVDAATEETVTATYSFDINIYSEEAGGYVQPEDGSVKITFDVVSDEINSAIEDTDTEVAVYYIAEDGGDIEGVDKVADISDKVEFETDHFSVYTVALKESYYKSYSVKISAVYKDGTSIGKTENKTVTLEGYYTKRIDTTTVAKSFGISNYTFASATYNSGDESEMFDTFVISSGKVQLKSGGRYGDIVCDDAESAPQGSIVFTFVQKGNKTGEHLDLGFRDKTEFDRYRTAGAEVYAVVNGKSFKLPVSPVGKDGYDTQMQTWEYRLSSSDYGRRFEYDDDIVFQVRYNGQVYQKASSTAMNQAAYNNCYDTHHKIQNDFGFDYVFTFEDQFEVVGNLKYHKNDGSSTMPIGYSESGTGVSELTFTVKDITAVPFEPDSLNPGYTFEGWAESKDGPVKYTAGDTITVPKDGEKNLYAKWKKSDYQVTFIGKYYDDNAYQTQNELENKQYSVGTTGTATVPYSDIQTIANKDAYKSDYAVEGFYNDANLTSKITGNLTINAAKTIYIKYTKTRYSVHYSLSNDSLVKPALVQDSTRYLEGAAVTTKNPPEVQGYKFEGWVKGTNDTVTPGSTFRMPASNVELVGKYVARTDVTYIVEHYKQKADLTGYPTRPDDTDSNLKGTTGQPATYTNKTYEGFEYKEAETKFYSRKNGRDTEITNLVQADGSLVIKLHYDRKPYEVTYSYTNTVPNANPANPASLNKTYYFGQTVTVAKDATAPGYTFAGWTVPSGIETSKNAITGEVTFTMPAYDVEIKGGFTVNKHKVSYRYEGNVPNGVDPKAKDLPKNEEHDFGTSVTTVSVTAPAGYEFSGWMIENNTLTLNPGEEIVGDSFTMPDNDVSLYGSFTANKDTHYEVEYYQQNIENDEYTMYEADRERTGETNTMATNYVKGYEGFTYDHTVFVSKHGADEDIKNDATILGDGSLVIRVYYVRNKYNVSYSYTNTVPGADPSNPATLNDTYKYKQEVTIAADATAAGYVFSGWDAEIEDQKVISTTLAQRLLALITGNPVVDTVRTFEMPASNVLITGSFTANDDTVYTVEHYKKDFDGKYVLADTDANTKGTTGQIATYSSRIGTEDYVGFTYLEDETKFYSGDVEQDDATILGDGSLVIKLYYDRNEYQVTYRYDGVVPTDANPTAANLAVEPYTKKYLFGQQVTVADDATATGYTFSGWNVPVETTTASVNLITSIVSAISGQETKTTRTFNMPAQTVEIVGSFEINKHKVIYEYTGEVPEGADPTAAELAAEPYTMDYDYHATVTVADKAVAPEGYFFSGWISDDEDITSGSFLMPDKDVTIKGHFEKKKIITIRLNMDADGHNDKEVLYDGTPYSTGTNVTVKINSQDGSNGEGALEQLITAGVLVVHAEDGEITADYDGDTYVVKGIVVTEGSGIDSGVYYARINTEDVAIYRDDKDVTEEFDLALDQPRDSESDVVGRLTIKQRKVVLTSDTASQVYNGSALERPVVQVGGDGFVDGEVENLRATGSITNVGSTPNPIAYDIAGKYVTDDGIDEKLFNTNYAVTENIGTLTITSGGGGGDDTPDTPSTPTTIPDAPVATAPAPVGAVLGAQRDVLVDGPAVLGARRAGTDDTTSRTARAFVVLVSAAVALSLLISGKKKREN